MNVLPADMDVHCVCAVALGDQKKGSGPLEVESQMVIGHCVLRTMLGPL